MTMKKEEKGNVRGEDTGNVKEPQARKPRGTKRSKRRKTPMSPGY